MKLTEYSAFQTNNTRTTCRRVAPGLTIHPIRFRPVRAGSVWAPIHRLSGPLPTRDWSPPRAMVGSGRVSRAGGRSSAASCQLRVVRAPVHSVKITHQETFNEYLLFAVKTDAPHSTFCGNIVMEVLHINGSLQR